MIIVKNLTKNIIGEPLFEKASFIIHRGEKVGLVGPNGSGKSSILKIIAGQTEFDGGIIDSKGEQIGYLEQQALESDGDVLNLSGGEKTKIALQRVLASKPTMLLLDEPSNHLDSEGFAWLEQLLKNFKGGFLLVSHDRRLLDGVCHRILEIDPVQHTLKEYRGGYSAYVVEKEKQTIQQQEAYDQQQKEKKRLELWLALKKQEAHFYVDPAKGKQIRAMEKRLQREVYDQEIARPNSHKVIKNFRLQGEAANPKLIMRAQQITKQFADRQVLRNVTIELRGRERVLVAGSNGSGKTTLLKILIGVILPDKGEIRVGEGVRIGYFDQQHHTLDPNKTVMEEFLNTERPNYNKNDARAILGTFLFTGANVFKKVADLSVGQRVRLMFAKLTSQENELLILDEPTNHLDIQSREIIESALLNYQGAIVVVSHDCYFLNKIGITRKLTIEAGILTERS